MKIDEEDVYKSFYEFYHKGSNKVDMLRDKGTANFEEWDKKKWVKLAKDNPVKFLIKSEGKFFGSSKNDLMILVEDMRAIIEKNGFVGQMRDAIVYRNEKYYKERSFNL